jgi:GNAT superfamily N-acetyltransferase
VLRALEDAARELGWTRLVLETGTEQHAAIRFYQREGYVPIPLFGHYVGSAISLCYERVLAS